MAVKYTIYDPSVVTPNLLEETNLGPLDFRIIEYIERVGLTEITDRDNDGYLEIDLESLEIAMQALGMDEVSVPMAPYFSDTRRFTGRLDRLPDRLASATRRFDLIASREYFTNRFRGEANPLGSVANLLAKHLSAWAVHGGVSIAVPLENESGFSVYGDGRLRFDCDLFAQLGHSDLKGIPGLQFRYIVMSKNNTDNCSPLAMMATMETMEHHRIEQSMRTVRRYSFETPSLPLQSCGSGHMVLLVSDDQGRHLIVDNTQTIYFEAGSPYRVIHNLYDDRFSHFTRYLDDGTRSTF